MWGVRQRARDAAVRKGVDARRRFHFEIRPRSWQMIQTQWVKGFDKGGTSPRGRRCGGFQTYFQIFSWKELLRVRAQNELISMSQPSSGEDSCRRIKSDAGPIRRELHSAHSIDRSHEKSPKS